MATPEGWRWLAPSLRPEDFERVVDAANDEAEQKAARRFGVPSVAVSMAAFGRWGTGLTAERERRIAELASTRLDRRSVQAARGHVTRALLRELAPLLELAARHEALRRA